MNAIRNSLAADINRFHELACKRADEAIGHAKQAGVLLLEAKAAMKHGDWLPWLEQNILVGARQVQRYIQVAQGRALPIRSHAPSALEPVKNDKVSHLEVNAPRLFPGVPDAPALFIPDNSLCYSRVLEDGTVYLIEPSSRHPGYFFVSRLNCDSETYDCTRRPIAAEWVGENLSYYGLNDLSWSDWRVAKSAGVLTAMQTFAGGNTMVPPEKLP